MAMQPLFQESSTLMADSTAYISITNPDTPLVQDPAKWLDCEGVGSITVEAVFGQNGNFDLVLETAAVLGGPWFEATTYVPGTTETVALSRANSASNVLLRYLRWKATPTTASAEMTFSLNYFTE